MFFFPAILIFTNRMHHSRRAKPWKQAVENFAKKPVFSRGLEDFAQYHLIEGRA
jgi:hypothetical protein